MSAHSCKVECRCGHNWHAVTEEADDDAPRISGFECSRCGKMEGVAIEKPQWWETLDEAVTAVSPPMARLLEFRQPPR